jgi:hypothetical protein
MISIYTERERGIGVLCWTFEILDYYHAVADPEISKRGRGLHKEGLTPEIIIIKKRSHTLVLKS